MNEIFDDHRRIHFWLNEKSPPNTIKETPFRAKDFLTASQGEIWSDVPDAAALWFQIQSTKSQPTITAARRNVELRAGVWRK